VNTTLSLRAYDPRDEAAVWALHEWAMRDTGVDPADVPGTDDLRSIESSYVDVGGGFVVGTVGPTDDASAPESEPAGGESLDALATHDGTLAAMGGYVPNRAGHSDERDWPGSAELHRMRVAPPYQRRGYGEVLLAELERRAAADGFPRVLATTSTRQAAAVEFYRTHGYKRATTSTAGAYELVHFEKEL